MLKEIWKNKQTKKPKKPNKLKAIWGQSLVSGKTRALSLSAGEHWHYKDIIVLHEETKNKQPGIKYCKYW